MDVEITQYLQPLSLTLVPHSCLHTAPRLPFGLMCQRQFWRVLYLLCCRVPPASQREQRVNRGVRPPSVPDSLHSWSTLIRADTYRAWTALTRTLVLELIMRVCPCMEILGPPAFFMHQSSRHWRSSTFEGWFQHDSFSTAFIGRIIPPRILIKRKTGK